MKLDYNITRNDFFWFLMHGVLSNRALWLINAFMLVFTVGTPFLLRRDETDAPLLGFAVLGLLIFVIFVPLTTLISIGLRALLTNGKGILGKHRLELTDAGITESNDSQDNTTKWSGIVKIKHYRRLTAIFITAHSAIIVPNSAFTTAEERARFMTLLETHQAMGKPR